MANLIYLYLKTHNKTGLNYLGKTIKNPYVYKGSGKYWLKHIKKYGNDVSTRILKECQNENELKQWGLIYSRLFDVINNPKFANLIPESGEGALIRHTEETKDKIRKYRSGKKLSNYHIQRIKESHIGIKLSEETKFKMSLNHKGFSEKKHSEQTKIKMSQTKKGKPHNDDRKLKHSIIMKEWWKRRKENCLEI